MSRSRIIILNGIGSVGKSSTAKALQAITSKPFLPVAAMDAFLDMLPEKMLAHPDGLRVGSPRPRVRLGGEAPSRSARH